MPYGVPTNPTIGSYHMTAIMDGIPITDKKMNSMGKDEYGFYVTVSLSYNDFRGISDSDEPFKEVREKKGYEEKVRVIALNDNGVLTSKSPEAFASWFSSKLVNGYLRWCRLNRAAMHATTAAAGAAAVDRDDYTIQSGEEEEAIEEELVDEVNTTDEDEVDEALDRRDSRGHRGY